MEVRQWQRGKRKNLIRGVQKDTLRGLFDVKKIDRMPHALIREVCGVMKGGGGDERIEESILKRFGYTKRKVNNRTKRIYVGECMGNHSVG